MLYLCILVSLIGVGEKWEIIFFGEEIWWGWKEMVMVCKMLDLFFIYLFKIPSISLSLSQQHPSIYPNLKPPIPSPIPLPPPSLPLSPLTQNNPH
jgi:hypothetical protein